MSLKDFNQSMLHSLSFKRRIFSLIQCLIKDDIIFRWTKFSSLKEFSSLLSDKVMFDKVCVLIFQNNDVVARKRDHYVEKKC